MPKGRLKIIYIVLILIAIAAVIYGLFFYKFPSIELNITKNTSATTSIPSGQAVLARGVYEGLQNMLQWFSNLVYSR